MTGQNRAKGQTAKAAGARAEILTKAAQMMRRVGYSDMSLRDLAREVGMKAGSLYYHFPSKDALAMEVMSLGVENVRQAVQSALVAHEGAPARARLVVAMRAHLESLLSESDFSSAHIRCYPFAPSAVRAGLTEIRRAYDRDWDGLIAAFLERPEEDAKVRQLRHILLGAMNWSLEWFDPKRDSVEAYLASLEDLIAR